MIYFYIDNGLCSRGNGIGRVNFELILIPNRYTTLIFHCDDYSVTNLGYNAYFIVLDYFESVKNDASSRNYPHLQVTLIRF